jgi:hypothetical protein
VVKQGVRPVAFSKIQWRTKLACPKLQNIIEISPRALMPQEHQNLTNVV